MQEGQLDCLTTIGVYTRLSVVLEALFFKAIPCTAEVYKDFEVAAIVDQEGLKKCSLVSTTDSEAENYTD